MLHQPQTQRQMHQIQPTSQTNGAGSAGGVWADLVSLQAPASSSSLPLQFQPAQPMASQGQQMPQQTPYSASVGSYQTGMGMGVNPYQQQTMTSNPYSQQQQYSTSTMPPFSAGVSSFSPAGMLGQQQQYFSNQSQVQPPMSAQQGQFFQPQPQQGHLQIQVPGQNQTSFPSPIGQNSFMSAPVQGQFLSSSPGQQFPSHSPQPQMQMMSTTPQPQMQMQMPMQQGQYMSHSPQPGMGMGMMSSTPQGQFLSTTPQPQTQMQMQPGQYMSGTPQPNMQMMSQQQGQFGGGFQGQGQQMYPTGGGYGGQQWGAM
jgi:stromal membrane-associated protein